MDTSTLLCLLVALSCLQTGVLCFAAYELRQLRMGRASMAYWERVEAIHRNTTKPRMESVI